MITLDTLPETATVEQAVDVISQFASTIGITGTTPDVRTLRLWRTQKHLTINGRSMTRRNLLEVFLLLRLRQDGLTLSAAAEQVRSMDEDRLRLALTDLRLVAPSLTRSLDTEAIITVQHLAIGILRQHRLVRGGAIVGHTGNRSDGVPHTAIELQQAQARLSRYAMLEGSPDQTSSVHSLLRFCMKPLVEWAPQAICAVERYRDAILIDPIYLVPSEECEAIAEEVDASNLSDLIEHHLHSGLQDSLRRLGSDADFNYTHIREFIARHPLATTSELQRIRRNAELSDEAIAFITQIYQPVHAMHAVAGMVHRCNDCAGLITTEGHCILASCAETHPDPQWTEVPLSDAWIALPEVLKFWADPAQEELRLYDSLSRTRSLQGRVWLYPHSDRCDVSIGDTIGIDVKDYKNPRSLARRLNRSIGGLSMYSRRILAIADRRWKIDQYEDQLREELNPDRQRALEIMSVSRAIRMLKQITEVSNA